MITKTECLLIGLSIIAVTTCACGKKNDANMQQTSSEVVADKNTETQIQQQTQRDVPLSQEEALHRQEDTKITRHDLHQERQKRRVALENLARDLEMEDTEDGKISVYVRYIKNGLPLFGHFTELPRVGGNREQHHDILDRVDASLIQRMESETDKNTRLAILEHIGGRYPSPNATLFMLKVLQDALLPQVEISTIITSITLPSSTSFSTDISKWLALRDSIAGIDMTRIDDRVAEDIHQKVDEIEAFVERYNYERSPEYEIESEVKSWQEILEWTGSVDDEEALLYMRNKFVEDFKQALANEREMRDEEYFRLSKKLFYRLYELVGGDPTEHEHLFDQFEEELKDRGAIGDP